MCQPREHAPRPTGMKGRLPTLGYTRDLGTAFRVVTAGGEGVVENPGVEGWQMAWSPDGGRLVYAPYEGGMRIVNSDGTRRRPLVAYSAGNIAWSPDGNLVAHNRGMNGIWVTRPASGDSRLLVDHEGTGLAWSPDGQQIAYTHRRVCQRPLTKNKRQSLFLGDCLSAEQTHDQGVFAVDLDGTVRRVTHDNALPPSWSPDGTRLVYGRRDGGIWTVNAGGGKPERLVPVGWSAVWSPDGIRVACALENGGVIVVNSDGTEQRKLTGDHARQVEWSPDGDHLVYETLFYDRSGWGVVVVNVDTSERRVVGSGRFPKWLDGGNLIYVKDRGVAVYTTNKPEVRLVAPGGMRWSPDGTLIAYARNDEGLFVADLHGRTSKTVGHPARNAQWSPDSTHLAYKREGGEVWVVEHATKAFWRVASEGVRRVRWSPDSTKLVYAREGHVFIVNTDGTERRRVAAGWSAVWSPDSTRLACTLENGGVFIVNTDGTEQWFMPDDRPVGPVWSPDGAKVAYHVSGGVVGVDIATGERKPLADDYCKHFAWSPDSRQVVYTLWAYRQVFVSDWHGPAGRRIATVNNDSGGVGSERILWSPDGRWVVYADQDGVHAVDIHAGQGELLVRADNTGLLAWTGQSRSGEPVSLSGCAAA